METKWYHGVNWSSSPQIGPASNCFQAQVWGPDGDSLACIEPTEDGVEANRHAHFIAAAPETATQRDELLEALKVFVSEYVAMINSGDCGNWNPENEPKVIKARSAIARATGASS